MSENVTAIAVSSGAARPSTPSAVASTSGKATSDAGKRSPAQAESIAKLNLDKAVRQLNIASKSVGRSLKFEVDLRSGHAVILVLNRDTGEVIRRIPPEDAKFTISTTGRASSIQLLDDLV